MGSDPYFYSYDSLNIMVEDTIFNSEVGQYNEMNEHYLFEVALKLSGATYEMQISPDTLILPDGWSLNSDSLSSGYGNYGFFGASYINNDTRQLAIVNSGTSTHFGPLSGDFWYDIISDICLVFGFSPWQQKSSLDFSRDLLKVHKEDYEIISIGHSLGGVLAATSALWIMDKTDHKVSCISIDAPGLNRVLRNFASVYDISWQDKLLQNIHNYMGPINLVNYWGEHAGQKHYLSVEEDRHLSCIPLQKFISNSFVQHSVTAMEKIYQTYQARQIPADKEHERLCWY